MLTSPLCKRSRCGRYSCPVFVRSKRSKLFIAGRDTLLRLHHDRGHSGVAANERADVLALLGRRKGGFGALECLQLVVRGVPPTLFMREGRCHLGLLEGPRDQARTASCRMEKSAASFLKGLVSRVTSMSAAMGLEGWHGIATWCCAADGGWVAGWLSASSGLCAGTKAVHSVWYGRELAK